MSQGCPFTPHALCSILPAEGACEVHLALPVPELAGPWCAQRARGRAQLPGAGQPHPERHSRHWAHSRPLQVQAGKRGSI